ncbi:hypothetical protein Adt_47717 [Abeliophyllum distichum]|uniref:Uncharacterized protein n=1 Tax=Abeliophyllum distichum TaxID=126358 RepID=A0ABD1NVY6_9LAMI
MDTGISRLLRLIEEITGECPSHAPQLRQLRYAAEKQYAMLRPRRTNVVPVLRQTRLLHHHSMPELKKVGDESGEHMREVLLRPEMRVVVTAMALVGPALEGCCCSGEAEGGGGWGGISST